MAAPVSGSWNCPRCARRVPAYVETCRCGEPRRNPALPEPGAAIVAETPGEEPESAGAFWRGLLRAAVIAAVTTVAAMGSLWSIARKADDAARRGVAPAATERRHTATGAAGDALDDADGTGPAPRDARGRGPGSIGHPPAAAAPELSAAAAGASAAPTPSTPRLAREDLVAAMLRLVVEIRSARGQGSGFLVAPDLVVTNAHVVGDEASVTVLRADGRSDVGGVTLTARDADLALVRVRATGSHGLTLRSVAQVRVGEEVLAIGAPRGFSQTVTRGIVSAIRRDGPVILVQTDAAVNPGNSGGPLVDADGRVVGVVTLKRQDSEAIGLAVAADHVEALLQRRPALSVDPRLTAAVRPEPAGPSTADALRDQGARRFEQVLAALAQHVARLASLEDAYGSNCASGEAMGAGERTGSATRGGAGFEHPQCVSMRGEIAALRAALTQRVADAEEDARRAGVYPGVIRDLRRRYQVDWN
jgi:S1-C subfamily serine protease